LWAVAVQDDRQLFARALVEVPRHPILRRQLPLVRAIARLHDVAELTGADHEIGEAHVVQRVHDDVIWIACRLQIHAGEQVVHIRQRELARWVRRLRHLRAQRRAVGLAGVQQGLRD